MDRTVFCELAMSEFDAVYRLAVHLSPRPADAEALVERAYALAFESQGHFERGEGIVKPWLFGILHDVLRSRSPRPSHCAIDVEPVAPPLSARSPALAASRGQWLGWEEVGSGFGPAVMGLPSDRRGIFLMSTVEGLRYGEIAEITGQSPEAVMEHVHLAWCALRAASARCASAGTLTGAEGADAVDSGPAHLHAALA